MNGSRPETGSLTIWQRIRQGVAALSLDTVIGLVTGVLGARLVFHYLSVAEYGRLALYISFYTTGTVLLDFGMVDVFTAEIASARGTSKPSWAGFLLSRYSLMVMSTATVLLLVFVGVGAQRGELWVWSIMGAYLWLTAVNLAAAALFYSTTRYRRLAGQSIVRNVSRLLLRATLPWWWTQQRLTGVALTYPLTELAVILASAYLARGAWAEFRSKSATTYSLRDLTPLFARKGIYATLTIPVKRFMAQLPVWLLKTMAGDVALGAYAAAEEAYILLFTFFGSVETTLLPLVSEQAQIQLDRLRVALRQAQKYTFWIGVLATIAGVVGARWLILLIAGEKYIAALPLLRLFLLLLPLNAFTQSQRPILHAVGEQKWILLIQVVSAVIGAILLLIGIHVAQATGAVWAVLIRSCATLVMGYVAIRYLAPDLWIDPRGIVKIEEFDRKLWRVLTGRSRE